MSYAYGEQVEYEHSLIKLEDLGKLQAFSCGNKKLDHFFHKELIHEVNIYGIKEKMIDTDEGLPYKVVDKKTGDIIAVYSLAASGIFFEQTNHMQTIPALKIDVFAVDERYQKMHMDVESQEEENPDEHRYLSDSIMCDVISRCVKISQEYATIRYIILYADKNAKRFYERNLFNPFLEFMKKERRAEIAKNDPMYMELDV